MEPAKILRQFLYHFDLGVGDSEKLLWDDNRFDHKDNIRIHNYRINNDFLVKIYLY